MSAELQTLERAGDKQRIIDAARKELDCYLAAVVECAEADKVYGNSLSNIELDKIEAFATRHKVKLLKL